MDEDAVSLFVRLPAADRRAIEACLEPSVRAAVAAAVERRRNPPAPSQPFVTPYSPWLRRHLLRALAEQPARTQTPHSQAILRTLLSEGAS